MTTYDPISPIQKTFKVIIFDVDGVLVDTEFLKFESWKEALAHYDIKFKLEDYNPMVGLSSENILKLINCKFKTSFSKDLIQTKDKFYKTKQEKGAPVFKAAVDFLKNIIQERDKGNIKVAIASSAPYVEIIQNIKRIGFQENNFDVIASGKDSLQDINDVEGVNKPKPYIYQYCLNELGVQPYDCIVFEDTNAGVMAANNAGIEVIAIPNSFTKEHNFSKAKLIESFDNLNFRSFIKTQ